MAIRINFLTQFDNRELKKAQRELGQIGQNITRTFDVAIAGAIAGVGVALAQGTKAAVEDAKSQALLATQLKNTVGASEGQIASVEKSISAMQLQASVADDEIRPAFASLVRATGDVGKATALTSLALDVAAGTGKDLGAVSLALGKAVNGSSTSLVKLVPSIKGASAPMAELEKQFTGAAAAAADADPFQRLQIIFGEISEQIGSAIVPALQEFATYLASTDGQAQLKQLVDGFKALGTEAVKVAKWITENKDLLISFGQGAAIVYGVVKAFEILTVVVKGAQVASALLAGTLTATPWGLVAAAVVGVSFALGNMAIEAHKAFIETEGVREEIELMGKGAINPTAAMARGMMGGVNPNKVSAEAKALAEARKKAAAETAKLNANQKELYEAMKKTTPQIDLSIFKTNLDTKTKTDNTKATKANTDAQKANSQARIEYWQNLVKEREAAAEAALAAQEALDELKTSLKESTAGIKTMMQTQADMGQFESNVVSAFENIGEAISSALGDGKITASAASNLSLLATSTQASIQAIAKQRDALVAKRSLVEALIGDVKGSLMGAGQLTGLLETQSKTVTKTVTSIVNGLKVAVSSTFEEVSSGGLLKNFKSVLDKTKAFATQLKTLKKLGLDQNLFKQIVDAGAEGGGALAAEIIAGGEDAVKELNTTYKDLADVSGQIAEQTAVVMFNDGKEVAGGLVAGLLSQEQALISAANTLANAFMDTFNSMIAKLAPPKTAAIPAEFQSYFNAATEGLTGSALTNQQNMLLGYDVSAPGSFMNTIGYQSSQGQTLSGNTVNVIVNAGVGTNGKAVGAAIQAELNKYASANA